MSFEQDRSAASNTVEHFDGSNAARAAQPAGREHGAELEQAVVTLERTPTDNIDQLNALCRQLYRAHGHSLDDDLLSETNQAIEQLRACTEELRQQTKGLHEAFALIERTYSGSTPPSPRTRLARKRGSRLLARVKVTLGQYWLIEANLARDEMLEAEFRCNRKLHKISELEERIAAIDKQRNELDGFLSRLIRRGSTRQKLQHLEQRRKNTQRKLRQESIEIEDADLQRWLGVLLSASLHAGRDTWWQHTLSARKLWYRLVSIRNWNMGTTERPASDTGTRSDDDDRIEHDRRGQLFIASAFAQQREQQREQAEPLARDSIDRMEEVRVAIASEYQEFLGSAC